MQIQKSKIPIVVVAGPTASGKTALSVELAVRLGGEVVSADSMQIYRDMQIGTARPTEDEMRGIKHHLLGFLPLGESFSVAQYVDLAREKIAEITARGKLPIIAGGTGLYISSLVNNICFSEEKQDENLRNELYRRAETEGAEALLKELAEFDPESAARLHPNNVGRIVRAIEIYRLTGVTMTQQLINSREQESPYDACMIGITFKERSVLYGRIERRVDLMIEQGLIDEAKSIFAMPCGKTALQAIGYKELEPYINGECDLEFAVANLKQQTRRYAKRQLTWFRRDERINWLEADGYADFKDLADSAEQIVIKSGILK